MNAATHKIAQLLMNNLCKCLDIKETKVCGKTRERDAEIARTIFSYQAHIWGMTYTDIGNIINRTHATVIYHVRAFDEKYHFDKYFQRSADAVMNHKLLKNSLQ
jgi:chromosomal replication initiation ATPase DnaA